MSRFQSILGNMCVWAVCSGCVCAQDGVLRGKFEQLSRQFAAASAADLRTGPSRRSEAVDGDYRGSRIIVEAPLPDPDLAAIRSSLGLEAPNGLEKPGARRKADTTPPTAADLAESDGVRLTPEIRDLAQRLGSPERIYAYVRDNTEYSLYYGAKQNSLAVLLSRRGNNVDTATLLIALMRASGIPARYAQAQVRASVEDVAAWVGARKPAALEAMTAVPLLATIRDSNVDFYHVWTEAWIGNKWVSFDASFKMLDYEPGIELPVQPFDMDAFLSTQRRELASDLYVDSVRAYLNRSYPGRGMSDVIYHGRLAPTGDRIEAPRYRVLQAMESRSDLDNLRHRIMVSLIRPSDSKVLLQREFSVPRTCLQSLTLISQGTPSRPMLRIDDEVAGTSTDIFASATALNFRVEYFYPGIAAADRTVIHTYTTGDVFTFGYNVAQVSEGVLQYRIDRLLATTGGLATDPIRTLGEILHIGALRYLHRVETEARSIYEVHHMDYLPTRLDSTAAFAQLPAVSKTDRPFLVTPQRLILDANGSFVGRSVSRNTGSIPSADFNGVIQALSPMLSGLEHEIWEEIVVTPTASTVKILQYAQDKGIPVLRITPAQAPGVVPTLPIPASIKTFLLSSATAGETIIIPSQAVTYFRWTGTVYTKRTATGGVNGWFVNQFNGGAPPKSGDTGNPRPKDGDTTGDPVNVSNGNMFYQALDISLPAAGLPLRLVRTYNSQAAEAGPFGAGWTHSYDMTIQAQGASLVYRNPTGGFELLTPSGTEWAGYRGMRVSRDGTGWRMRFRQGLELRFNAGGKFTSLTDPNGNKQTLDYDAQGNLASIADPAGRKITFSYNAQNRVTVIADFAGRQLAYRYDAAGDLIEAQDASGAVTRYAYYADTYNAHNMKSVTDPEGNTTSWVYFADDKVFKILGPGGGEMQLFYLPFRNETVVVDERGQSTTYQYDSAGRITRVVDALGNVIIRKYTAEGWLAEETDSGGNTTKLSWDALGNLTKVVDPLGNTTDVTYDPIYSRITQTRDAKGNTQTFEYDARGNLVRFMDATGAESRFTRDARGYITRATGADGNTWSAVYNDAGRITQLTDPNQQTARVEYSAAGRATAVVDALGARIQFEYDARDLLTRGVNAVGNETAFTYDRSGRTVRTTDGNRQAQQFGYDTSSNLARITTADARSVEYGSAPGECGCSSLPGMLSQIKDAKGAQSVYAYDPRGYVFEVRNAMGDAVRYLRDANGNLAEIAYDDGTAVRFTYDGNNQLTSRAYPDNTRDTFTYDAVGNLLTAANAHITYTFTYDARNRVSSVRDSRFSQPIRYSYDTAGRRQRVLDPQGTATAWQYHPDGALASIQSPDGQFIRFTYDAARRRVKTTFPNQTEAAYSYDAAGRLLSLTYKNATSQAELSRFAYTYDAAGNRTSMTDAAGTHRYSYDTTYRLTAATHLDQPAEQYSYDAAGNRTASHREPTFVYDAADRLTRTSGADYLYDRRGNLVMRTAGHTTMYFEYSYLNQLQEVENGVADKRTRGASATTTYKYDPFGRRIEKSVGGVVTRYLYDFAQILHEYDGAGRLMARYTYGTGIDEPLLMERDRNSNGSFEPNEAFFYQRDGLGSVRALTDRGANIVERYRYDTFGNLVDGAGAIGNPYFFTGREWDAETGLSLSSSTLRCYDRAVFADGHNLECGGRKNAQFVRLRCK